MRLLDRAETEPAPELGVSLTLVLAARLVAGDEPCLGLGLKPREHDREGPRTLCDRLTEPKQATVLVIEIAGDEHDVEAFTAIVGVLPDVQLGARKAGVGLSGVAAAEVAGREAAPQVALAELLPRAHEDGP